MTRPAGKAAVQVVGDVSTFAKKLQADLNKALRAVNLDVAPLANKLGADISKGVDVAQRSLNTLDDTASKVFTNVAQDADRAFDLVVNDAQDAGREIAQEIGDAGEKAERSLREISTTGASHFRALEQSAASTSLGISGIFGKLATVVTVALAGIQAVRFFSDAAQSAEDLGSAIENTQQIIKATGGAAGLLADQVRDIAQGLSLKIGVDSVEIQNAINVLLTFRDVSGPVLTEAIGLAADMTQVFGSDLSGAATQLGKALNDPIAGISALSRVGIQFTDQQKKQIAALVASGNLLGAQKIILEELRKEFGGVAEAGVDTTDQLSVAFGELKRALGGPIIAFLDEAGPSLIALTDSLKPAFTSLGESIGTALGAIIPIAEPLLTVLSSALAAIAPLLVPVGQLIASIAGALVPAIASLTPLLTGVTTLVTALFSPLGPILENVGQALADTIGPFAELFGQALVDAAPLVRDLVVQLGKSLGPVLEALAPAALEIVEALRPMLPALIDMIPPVTELVVELTPLLVLLAELLTISVKLSLPLIQLTVQVVKFLSTLRPAGLLLVDLVQWFGTLGDEADAVGGFFSEIGEWLASVGRWFADLPGKIADFLTSLPDLIAGFFQAAFDRALHAIGVGIGLVLFAVTQLPGLVIEKVQQLGPLLAEFFTNLWNQAVEIVATGIANTLLFFHDLPANIAAALASLTAIVGDLFTAALEWGKQTVIDGFNNIVEFVRSVPSRIAGLASDFLAAGRNLIAGFFNGLSSAGSFVGDLASSIVSKIKGFLNSVIGKINSGIASVDDLLPGSLPRIPMLAAGAVITRPTLAGLGEAGTEVVIPLTRPDRARQLVEESGLDRLLGATAVAGTGGGDINIRVFVGSREITDIVRVEIDEHDRDVRARVTTGAGRRR